jgi:SnoaL-like domain
MNTAERFSIERECEQLMVAYARGVDFRDYDNVASLFTENGVLDVGSRMEGRAAIQAALTRRPYELRSRHVLTNLFVDVVDRDTARGICYLTLYRHVGPESLERGPVELEGPAAVGHYEDRFVRTSAGFRIAQRTLHLAFRSSALLP